MTTLIERVARAAGWVWEAQSEQYFPAGGLDEHGYGAGTAEYDRLLPAGLLVLLEELLEAGWHVGKEAGRFLVATPASRAIGGYVFHFGPTLEEAVMLAYLAHRREK